MQAQRNRSVPWRSVVVQRVLTRQVRGVACIPCQKPICGLFLVLLESLLIGDAACFNKGLVGDHELLYASLRFWCVLVRQVHLVMHHKRKTLREARYMFTRAGFGDSMCAYKVRARHASYVRICSRLFLKGGVWGWHVSIQGACSRHAS